MSSYFEVRCETCQERGPQVARTAGAVFVTNAVPDVREAQQWGPDVEPQSQWAQFLTQHEYHDLRLAHESGAPNRA